MTRLRRCWRIGLQKYRTTALAAVHLMSDMVCASAAASSCLEGCGGATSVVSYIPPHSCNHRLPLLGQDQLTSEHYGDVSTRSEGLGCKSLFGLADIADDVHGRLGYAKVWIVGVERHKLPTGGTGHVETCLMLHSSPTPKQPCSISTFLATRRI